MQKLSWKERYAGILVLVIAVIYLLLQVISIASNTSDNYSANNGSLVVMKDGLFMDIKTWLLIIMALPAGPLLLKNKTSGWVLGLPVLMLFATFLIALIVDSFIKTGGEDGLFLIPGIMLVLALLAIIFLFAKDARRKYRVSNYTVLLTLFLFVAMGGLYYFLQ